MTLLKLNINVFIRNGAGTMTGVITHILISAGFDAHIEDDMSDLRLQDQDFAWVTNAIKTVADKYARGRIVSTLEGGYALSALGRSVAEHIKALIG